ncbi:MAG: Gfo/Idh/MocA family oxidoreductase [Spirochaetes bacterium]|nr:Gfo/Idh/MocA family oxidoreductase [Spirochaetota bacterium]
MVKIGVIGVGHMGEYHTNILKYLDKIGDIKFVGIFDINKKRMKEISNKYNVKYFNSDEELYKEVDAIICAVWSTEHYKVAKKALEFDVNILIEKPFSHLYNLAYELANLAKKKNLIIQIGHVERFNGAIVELRKKYVKEPILIEARRYGLFTEKKKDTGVILDLMIHDIDIILNIANSEIVDFDAFATSVYTEFEDIANAIFYFKNNCIASVIASRASYIKKRTLDIAQKSNYIFLNYDTQEIEIYRKSNTIFEVDQKEILYHRGAFIEKISVHVENALKDEIIHFINCVEGKEKPLFPIENDLNTLMLTLSVIKKASKKSKFKFEVDI